MNEGRDGWKGNRWIEGGIERYVRDWRDML